MLENQKQDVYLNQVLSLAPVNVSKFSFPLDFQILLNSRPASK